MAGKKMIIALSGGADSVVLLHKMLRAGNQCIAAHCNFHLRGEESMRDEHFVRELCAEWSVPLYVENFNTNEDAKAQGISIEMAAREERYRWFENLRKSLKADMIAIGHHQNDVAETVLLNLKRGTGIRGLQGIKEWNGYIYRPLLHMTKREIEDYATINHLSYVVDSTNTDTQFSRNKIRKQLQEYTDKEIKLIANACLYMQDYVSWINSEVDNWKEKYSTENKGVIKIAIEPILSHPAPKALLFELLHNYGFQSRNIPDILQSLVHESGKIFYSQNYVVLKDRKELLLYPRESVLETCAIKQTRILKPEEVTVYPKEDERTAFFSEKILKGDLALRHPKNGDFFIPIGMHGKKKIMDFLAEQRIPLCEKKNIWLLTCGRDIVWVVGYRIDNRYKVSEKDKHIVEIQLS